MKKKIIAISISAFMFIFSVPQSCFAELGSLLKGDKDTAISSQLVKAINLIYVSGKIIKKCYGTTKDFFCKMYTASFESGQVPIYDSKTEKIVFASYGITVLNTKKNIFGDMNYMHFERFMDVRMQSTSPPGNLLIAKQYLLSIEALQKGSVPASLFTIKNNILNDNSTCPQAGRISFWGKL